MVFKVFQKLFTTLYNYFICLLGITNFKILTETLLRISLSVIGQCSLVMTYICCRKNALELTFFSQAASDMIFLNHRRRLPVSIRSVKIAASGSLKQITGRISKEQAKL
jgi:hypothetical protein